MLFHTSQQQRETHRLFSNKTRVIHSFQRSLKAEETGTEAEYEKQTTKATAEATPKSKGKPIEAVIIEAVLE